MSELGSEHFTKYEKVNLQSIVKYYFHASKWQIYIHSKKLGWCGLQVKLRKICQDKGERGLKNL